MKSEIYQAHLKSSNEFIVKIMWVWTIIQFPIGFTLALFKLFYVGPSNFIALAAFLFISNFILGKLMKRRIKDHFMPYYLMSYLLVLIAVTIFFYINDLAMQILWLFPIIMSFIYFDRRLTIFTIVGSIVGLTILDIIQPLHPHPDRFNDLFLTAIVVILGTIVTFYFLAIRIRNLFNLFIETDTKLNISYLELGQSHSNAKILSEELTKAAVSLAATTEYVNNSVSELASQSNSASLSIERVVNETKHADELVKKMLDNFDANVSQARQASLNHLLATEKIHKTLQNIADSLNHTEQINQSLDVILELIDNLKRRCYEVNKILDFVYSVADQNRERTESSNKETRGNVNFEQIITKTKDFSRTAQNIVTTAESNVQSIFDEISAIKLVIENEIRIALDVRRQLGITQLIVDRNKRHIEQLDGQFEVQRKTILEMPDLIDVINSSIQEVAVLMEINAAFSEETSASMQDLSTNAKKLGLSSEILKRSYHEENG